jgi:hypothetical protein
LLRPGYAAVALPVEVEADRERAVETTMEKSGLQLGDFRVTAPRIVGGSAGALDQRREAATVSDVLGAEQMSKSGDSDAASALKRVTGLTVIGGKYVYVRGLGDRYSSTLLNGSSLPSPEPEKRVVPLDIFPTSLVEEVVIQKTFSPDRPAEWGGGVVEVKTRRIPERPFFSLGVSGAYEAGTTFETGLQGPLGPTDWLGLGRDYRALPASVAEASADAAIKPAGIFSEGGYDADELEELGEAFVNRWGLSTREIPPDFGVTLGAGGRLKFGELSLGALTGLVYQNSWDLDAGTQSVFSQGSDGLVVSRRTTFNEAANEIRVGAALALSAEWGDDFSITSTSLLNRASTASALSYDADDPTGNSDTRTQRIDWVEQQLAFEQIAARADFDVVAIDARFATAAADRDEPDRREWTYNRTDDGSYVLSQRGGWSDIQYLTLDDANTEGGLDVTVPVPPLGKDTHVKVGGVVSQRARDAGTRRFGYKFHGTEGIDLAGPVEEVFTAENIGAEEDGDPGWLQIEENTINSDDYGAEQELYAGYALADAGWTPRLRTLAGVRLERSVQSVTTFEQFDTAKEPIEAELGATDWLPAATVSVGIGPEKTPDRMLLRAAYGRTVSRPEFRELTEVQYYDYRTGRTLYGNPDLHRATIDHADLRWEWYPRDGESFSFGLFYKYFDMPIESVVAISAVSGSVGTFANATSATNVGCELDGRQRLDIVADWMADVVVGGNVAFIASQVDLSETAGNQTSEERPLQGQSPWVVNATIGYDNPDIRTSVSLLYNVFGPRIVAVGTAGIPDTYELPVHQLDLVWTQGLTKQFQTKLKAANLLDWPARQAIGDEISLETRRGWSVSAGLTWTP